MYTPSSFRFAGAAGGLCLALAVAPPAAAQSAADSATAQALFDQAKELMKEGRAAEACPKFVESQRLDPGGGTLLNLGGCYEKLGKLASAWTTYLEAVSVARTAGNKPYEAAAQQMASALAPRLSRLVIELDASMKTVDGLQIRRDGLLVGEPQWGLPLPLDEGEHKVTASAPGRVAWETVTTVRGEGTTTKVSVPALAVDASAPPPAAAAPPPPEAPVRDSGGLGTGRTVALVAGAVGVIGIAFGTVFGLKSKSKHDEATKYCEGAACTDQRGVTLGDEAQSAGNLATVGFIVGGVGLAGGLALWFSAPSPGSAASAEVRVAPGFVRVKGVW